MRSTAIGLLIVRLIVVDAETAPFIAVTTNGYVLAVAEDVAVRDIVVVHVGAQLDVEKEAETPVGKALTENETDPKIPDSRLAVTGTVTPLPLATETAGAEEESEIATGTAEVVKLASDEYPARLEESCETA